MKLVNTQRRARAVRSNNSQSMALAVTAKRLKHWSFLTLFSVVSFGAIYENTKDDDQDAIVQFVLIVAATTICIGLIFMVNSKWSEFTGTGNFFNGTTLELTIATFLVIMWGVCLGFINMRDIGGGATQNANIYYFSWGAFLAVVVLWSDNTNEFFDASAIIRRHPRCALWTLESACNIIVMTTASADYRDDCDGMESTNCTRLVYGVGIGAASAFISMFMLVLLHNCHQPSEYLQIEANGCAIIAVAFSFGVYYLTGADGPAKAIGNLYYFSWMSFLSSVVLFLDCFDKITHSFRISHNRLTAQQYNSQTICSEDDSDEDDDNDNDGNNDDAFDNNSSGSPFFECDDSSYTEDPHQVQSTDNITNPNQGHYGNYSVKSGNQDRWTAW